MAWQTGGVTSQSPAVPKIPATFWWTTTGRRSLPASLFCWNPGALKTILLSQTNECIPILSRLVGLSGETEGLVFMELYVHWRWCGNDVYPTGRVYLELISLFHIYLIISTVILSNSMDKTSNGVLRVVVEGHQTKSMRLLALLPVGTPLLRSFISLVEMRLHSSFVPRQLQIDPISPEKLFNDC